MWLSSTFFKTFHEAVWFKAEQASDHTCCTERDTPGAMATKQQNKQPRACFSFPLRNVPLWFVYLLRLIFILSGWSASMQNRHDNTYCPWKERSMFVSESMWALCLHTNEFEDNLLQNTWMGMELCIMFWYLISALSPVPPQNLSGEDAAHLVYRGQNPACSGQVSGWAETKSHSGTPLER